MNYTELNSVLIDNTSADPKTISNETYRVYGLTLIKLRDILYRIGSICYEDLETGVYVASLKGGIKKKNTTVLALYLENEALKISVSAKEGIIKQHTKEDVLYELKKSLKDYIAQK